MNSAENTLIVNGEQFVKLLKNTLVVNGADRVNSKLSVVLGEISLTK